jgi:energy-coupling factor transporter ATP-binding protein EcfA2
MPRPRHDLFEVKKLGPIHDISFVLGDLTLLVGAQGTGKSIALQLLKLAHDRLSIARTARDNSLTWSTAQEFLDAYLGTGLGSSWRKSSVLRWKGKVVSLPPRDYSEPPEPKVFYVPAQRAITIADGWPRPFSSYRSAPYVVREFGLHLQRILLASRGQEIFPSPSRLKADLRRAIDEAVFHHATLELRRESVQNEMKLVHGEAELSYMAWSAGQREFVPLLLALYDLLPASARTKHAAIDWVILEEPEMGLHPEAIAAAAALILDLLHRDYRVVVSTHHPLMLDVVWLIRELSATGSAKPKDLLRAFGLEPRGDMTRMASNVLKKDCRVYNLIHTAEGVVSRDISSLDPSAEDDATAGWGGLTGISERFHEQLGRVLDRMGTA